jgi:hypothetical protein
MIQKNRNRGTPLNGVPLFPFLFLLFSPAMPANGACGTCLAWKKADDKTVERRQKCRKKRLTSRRAGVSVRPNLERGDARKGGCSDVKEAKCQQFQGLWRTKAKEKDDRPDVMPVATADRKNLIGQNFRRKK